MFNKMSRSSSAAGQLLARPLVEPRQSRRDGLVDLAHAGELVWVTFAWNECGTMRRNGDVGER